MGAGSLVLFEAIYMTLCYFPRGTRRARVWAKIPSTFATFSPAESTLAPNLRWILQQDPANLGDASAWPVDKVSRRNEPKILKCGWGEGY